eukprot:gene21932-28978_t
MEYRGRSAKLCLQKACSGASEGAPPTEPEKYVRRAAELCAKAEFQVPGLSREFVEYMNAHASNACDAQGGCDDDDPLTVTLKSCMTKTGMSRFATSIAPYPHPQLPPHLFQ